MQPSFARLSPLVLALLGPLSAQSASAQAPILQSATSSAQAVTLTLQTTTQTPAGPSRYWIWRSTAPGGSGDGQPYATWTLPDSHPAIGATVQLTDVTAANGQTYYYRVALAADKSVQVPKSNELSVVSQVLVAPPAQVRIAAAVGGQVLLVWSKAAGAAQYSVKRSGTYGSGYALLAKGVSTTYLDTGLKADAPCYYVVTALTESGSESAPSNAVFVVPSLSAYRIDVGSATAFADVRGGVWMMDTGAVTGGEAFSFTRVVPHVPASDQPLYQTQRIGHSFTYTLAAPNGDYLLGLLFAEMDPTVTKAGQRVCRVTSGGQTLLTCDAFAEGGAGAGVTEVTPVKVTGGYIALTFTGVGTNGTAALAALQLGLLPPSGGFTPFIPGASTALPDVPAPGWAEGVVPMDGD